MCVRNEIISWGKKAYFQTHNWEKSSFFNTLAHLPSYTQICDIFQFLFDIQANLLCREGEKVFFSVVEDKGILSQGQILTC